MISVRSRSAASSAPPLPTVLLVWPSAPWLLRHRCPARWFTSPLGEVSKASSLNCFHLPARQLKRKYATSQQCRNYKSIQECSVHGDIHLFASVQPTAECHSQQDESSSSQWWSQGSDARTLLRSWHLHVSPLCHQDSKKGFSPFQHKGYLMERRHTIKVSPD